MVLAAMQGHTYPSMAGWCVVVLFSLFFFSFFKVWFVLFKKSIRRQTSEEGLWLKEKGSIITVVDSQSGFCSP